MRDKKEVFATDSANALLANSYTMGKIDAYIEMEEIIKNYTCNEKDGEQTKLATELMKHISNMKKNLNKNV